MIVAADDAVEPIIGFVNSDTYDPSPQNPLKVLIERDVPNRVTKARKIEQDVVAKGKDRLAENDKAIHNASVKAKRQME